MAKAYKPYSVSISASGTSDWISLDHYPTSGIYTIEVEGTFVGTYSVEFTIDDPASSPSAIEHDVIQSKTTPFASDLFNPVRGFRLNVSAYTSGTLTLKVLEGGR